MNVLCKAAVPAALLALSACSTTPTVDLTDQTKQVVKRIAIVQVAEPAEYMMLPSRNPAGAALYMFGALGGAVLGGIQASTQKTATRKFTQAVTPSKPNVQSTFQDRVATGLKAKGYDVVLVPAPPKKNEDKDFDLLKVPGNYDAYLIANFSGGYVVSGKRAAPRLEAAVLLVDRTGEPKYFSQRYVYGDATLKGPTQLKAEPRFVFDSEEGIIRNASAAAEALRTGATKIADEVVARF